MRLCVGLILVQLVNCLPPAALVSSNTTWTSSHAITQDQFLSLSPINRLRTRRRETLHKVIGTCFAFVDWVSEALSCNFPQQQSKMQAIYFSNSFFFSQVIHILIRGFHTTPQTSFHSTIRAVIIALVCACAHVFHPQYFSIRFMFIQFIFLNVHRPRRMHKQQVPLRARLRW
jgi:hypothetical protein